MKLSVKEAKTDRFVRLLRNCGTTPKNLPWHTKSYWAFKETDPWVTRLVFLRETQNLKETKTRQKGFEMVPEAHTQ